MSRKRSDSSASSSPKAGERERRAAAEKALLGHLPVGSLLEAMPDAIAIYGVDGALLFTNAVMRQLFGLDNDPDFHTQGIAQRAQRLGIRHISDAPMSSELWHVTRLLRGETITSEQPTIVRLTSLDGVDRTVSITGAPISDEDGELLGAIAIARDITHLSSLQNRTQVALEALLEMAEAVVSTTTIDDVDIGADGQDANATLHRVGRRLIELARSVLGCQRIALSVRDPESGVMRALAVSGLTPAEERQWWVEQRAAEEQGARLEDMPDVELVESLLAGDSVSIDMGDAPYRDVPNPYGITTMLIAPMLVGRDLYGIISLDYAGEPHKFTAEELKLASAVSKLAALVMERERLLREQAAAEARALALTQANQRMNEFLSVAAHELRTPITVIKANLQLLTRRAAQLERQTQAGGRSPEDERLAQHGNMLLARTERSLTRLTRLVDDLLDVSRIRAGRLEMRIEPINLCEVARDAVEEQRLAAMGREITLAEPDGAPLMALADATRIDQVITNFVTNALKYSHATAPVRAQLWRAGTSAFVSVSDSGVGIPAEEQEHVWDLFYRIPGVEVVSGSGVGLGLGLHLCKTIIERQGGAVGLTSQVGAGSTFWFSLPLLPEQG
ncbi:MAG TPA: ATP-binding protein [Ktedonobacterales bacterium]